MGFFSRFENHMEDGLEGAADKMFDAPISPVQISKKAEKAMRREKMVGAGKQYAPTLYTILVNADDDQRLFGYYPTLAGETETYLAARASDEGYLMDGQPLVRFIVDDDLKRGKFEVIAELVSAPIIAQLRQEEMQRYGIAPKQQARSAGHGQPPRQQYAGQGRAPQQARQQAPQSRNYAPMQSAPAAAAYASHPRGAQNKQQLPYVPEDQIDRSIDYGEYTFDSQDFDDYKENGPSGYQPSTVAQPASGNPATRSAAGNPMARPIDQVYAENIASHENDMSGLDVDTFDPYTDDSESVPNASQYGNRNAGMAAANDFDIPRQAPATTVFAAGAAEASPMPNQSFVRARLVDAQTNQAIDLASNRLIMGRSSSSDIVLDDINASRNHAELRFEPQGVWSITDLGSTNGTLVNGQRITSCTLSNGDRISVGMINFIFTQD